MDQNTVVQLVRMLMIAVGSYFLGEGVVNSEMYQAFVGGAINVVSFVWWYIWNRTEVKAA